MAFFQDFPTTFKESLRQSKRILQSNLDLVSQEVVETEAEQIVLAAYRQHTAKRLTRITLYSKWDDRIPDEVGKQVIIWSHARAEGKLLQHLIGYQQFFNHEYEVNSEVLIPRPETECLVEAAIQRLGNRSAPLLGLEVGLGSGAISVELLSYFPQLRMMASEFANASRAVAWKNAHRILGSGPNGAERLQILEVGHAEQVFEPFGEAMRASHADFIISNPPYLIQNSQEVTHEVLAHEPHIALFAPVREPIYFYRKIAEGARALIKPGSFVFLEIPHERAQSILDCFDPTIWKTELVQDLTQRDRVVIAQLIDTK